MNRIAAMASIVTVVAGAGMMRLKLKHPVHVVATVERNGEKMSWDENDIYYNPEKFGLTTIGTVELNDEPYEFWTLLVQEKDGKFYVNSDSGCSCPSPFENYTTFESLGQPLTASEAADKVTQIGRGATREADQSDDDGYVWRTAFTPNYLPLVAKILNHNG